MREKSDVGQRERDRENKSGFSDFSKRGLYLFRQCGNNAEALYRSGSDEALL